MRYFIEVSYKGTHYAGFQVQQNANTIQAEIHRALSVVLKSPIELTGASRTDAGVHAIQNYFHFDIDSIIDPSILYNINAILPWDIAANSIRQVQHDAHCRFAATSREYNYFITSVKDPFSHDSAWFYPFTVEVDILNKVANSILHYQDFTSFSKRNAQVYTHQCSISQSHWFRQNDFLIYHVKSNRFLRGMVRGLVGTMLLVGRKKITEQQFHEIVLQKDCTNANFATPPHGLYLQAVHYPQGIFLS